MEMNEENHDPVYVLYLQLDATLDLINELRDPVITDCPMLTAAARAKKVVWGALPWLGEPDAMARLQSVWADFIPPVQAFFARQRLFDFESGTVHIPSLKGISALDEDGLLPPGDHHATWEEFVARFGQTDRRERQTLGLLAALHLLKQVGCRTVHVGGSFVTAKEDPKDIDFVFLRDGVDFDRLEPMLNRETGHAYREARSYFGIDGGAGDIEYVRKHRQRRTIVDKSPLWSFADKLAFLQPITMSRVVGTVVLDLTQPLPEAKNFSPYNTWDSWSDRMEFMGRF